jgi:DNA-3-methyladenine glycosylase
VRPLPAAFYARPTPSVARRLLGHILVSEIGGRRTAGRIVEVEAYVGVDDPACHGFGGHRTRRCEALYGKPGSAYVYFTYGMHWLLNAVTERAGVPTAVLIRALEPLEGLSVMRRRRGAVTDRALCAGPGRLCEALGITGREDGTSLQRGKIRIMRAARPRTGRVIAGPRVGITRAADWPLRFYLADSPWVSR